MELEIVENETLSFNLVGLSAIVPEKRYAEVGMELMNRMWPAVRSSGTKTLGVNHWVYLPGERMVVAVELAEGQEMPEGFESLSFELRRYVRHLHIGPYHELPRVWQSLKTLIEQAGETMKGPALEVYGHQGPEASKPPETTVLIGLAAN